MIKIKLYAAAIGAFILAVLTFGQLKKREGRKAEQAKRVSARLKAMQKKNEIEKDVSNEDRDSIIDRNTRP